MVIGVIGHRVKGQVKFSAGVAVVCQKCDQEKDEPHLQDNQCVCFRWGFYSDGNRTENRRQEVILVIRSQPIMGRRMFGYCLTSLRLIWLKQDKDWINDERESGYVCVREGE